MSNPDVMSRGEPFESATASAAPTPRMDIQVHASSCLSPIPGPNDLLLSYSSGEVSESTSLCVSSVVSPPSCLPLPSTVPSMSSGHYLCQLCYVLIKNRQASRPWPRGSQVSRAHRDCIRSAVRAGSGVVSGDGSATPLPLQSFRVVPEVTSNIMNSAPIGLKPVQGAVLDISGAGSITHSSADSPNVPVKSGSADSVPVTSDTDSTLVDITNHEPKRKRQRKDECQHQARTDIILLFQRMTRSLAHYDSVTPQQQQRRLLLLHRVLEALAIPRTILTTTIVKPSPSTLFHLDNHKLTPLRPFLSLPAYSAISRYRTSHAESDGTTTSVCSVTRDGVIIYYSYLTDPLRFIRINTQASSWMAIGGNTGGQLTKLGVTYETKGQLTRFAPLIVYTGKDDWDGLSVITESNLFKFTGESSHCHSYMAIFQRLVDAYCAFLNGDWNFINAILGLSTVTATYGCPICLATNQQRLIDAKKRCHSQ